MVRESGGLPPPPRWWLPALIGVLAALVAIHLVPMLLVAAERSYFFFFNGWDEHTYLSLQQAEAIRFKPGYGAVSWFVLAMHGLGVGGGALNAALDLVAPALAVGLLAAALGRGRWAPVSPTAALWIALVVVWGPALLNDANPLVAGWRAAEPSGLHFSDTHYLPAMRSPHPQLALLMLAAGAWLGRRTERPVVVAAALVPLVYWPFVLVLLYGVGVAVVLRWAERRWDGLPAHLAAHGAVIAGLVAGGRLVLPVLIPLLPGGDGGRAFSAEFATHGGPGLPVPVVMGGAVAAAALLWARRRRVEPPPGWLAWTGGIAAGGLVLGNLPWLTGITIRYNSYHNGPGTHAGALLLALGLWLAGRLAAAPGTAAPARGTGEFRGGGSDAVIRPPWWIPVGSAAVLAAIGATVLTTAHFDWDRRQYRVAVAPDVTPADLARLRTDPLRAVVAHRRLAMYVPMFAPGLLAPPGAFQYGLRAISQACPEWAGIHRRAAAFVSDPANVPGLRPGRVRHYENRMLAPALEALTRNGPPAAPNRDHGLAPGDRVPSCRPETAAEGHFYVVDLLREGPIVWPRWEATTAPPAGG